MTASMDKLSFVYNKLKTSGRNSTDSLENIPASCIQIYKSIEDLKKFLHKARKWRFLSPTVTLLSPESGLPICDEICALQSRIENLRKTFGVDSEDPLIRSFRDWEEKCDTLLKLRNDTIKLQTEYKRSLEKLQSIQSNSPEFDKIRKQTTEAEIFYFNKKEMLTHELYKFSLEEHLRSDILRKFLKELICFFSDCTAFAQFVAAPFTELQSKNFFGTAIEDHLNENNHSVVIKACIAYLMRTQSYKQQGIFRLSGQMSKIELLRSSFNQNKVDCGLLEFCGPDVVGDVLKQYLRELPESLLTNEFVHQWHQNMNKLTPQLARHLVNGLPESKRSNLILLGQLFGQIVEHKDESKMPASNLATVFYMNLYHSGNKQDDFPQTTPSEICHFVSYLSENCKEMFPDESMFAKSEFKHSNQDSSEYPQECSSAPHSFPIVPRRTYECKLAISDSMKTENSRLKAPPPVPFKSRRDAPPPPPMAATTTPKAENRSNSAGDQFGSDNVTGAPSEEWSQPLEESGISDSSNKVGKQSQSASISDVVDSCKPPESPPADVNRITCADVETPLLDQTASELKESGIVGESKSESLVHDEECMKKNPEIDLEIQIPSISSSEEFKKKIAKFNVKRKPLSVPVVERTPHDDKTLSVQLTDERIEIISSECSKISLQSCGDIGSIIHTGEKNVLEEGSRCSSESSFDSSGNSSPTELLHKSGKKPAEESLYE